MSDCVLNKFMAGTVRDVGVPSSVISIKRDDGGDLHSFGGSETLRENLTNIPVSTGLQEFK